MFLYTIDTLTVYCVTGTVHIAPSSVEYQAAILVLVLGLECLVLVLGLGGQVLVNITDQAAILLHECRHAH